MEKEKQIQTAFELREMAKTNDKDLDFYLKALTNASSNGNRFFTYVGTISDVNKSLLIDRGFRVETFEDQMRFEHTKISF